MTASNNNPNTQMKFEGFSKLNMAERREKLKEFCALTDAEIDILSGRAGLSIDQAEFLIENVVGLFSLPLGIATHFKIDGEEFAIPMVVEETSIVAGASAAAKWVHRNGGFKTQSLGNLVIGQVQFPTVANPEAFVKTLTEHKDLLLKHANSVVPRLVERGGGIQDIQIRLIDRPDTKTMAVLHILCNPCDAMGANIINQVCESLKSPLEELTGEKIGLCILSNLVDTKLVEARCEIKDIEPELAEAIVEATLFANLDPYRAATHNKGVLNGIDPILIATGNDWRAVEAGIHAYSLMESNKGKRSITNWIYENSTLKGSLKIPMAVGVVGGVTKIHPTARVCLKMMGIQHAEQLAKVCAAVGLAQNFAALRALCSEGIIQGHMKLHAANLALAAGATQSEAREVQKILSGETKISFSRAQEVLSEVRNAVKQ